MMVNELAREYFDRAKDPANEVRYHWVEVTEEEICGWILTGLSPALNFVHEGVALRIGYYLLELD